MHQPDILDLVIVDDGCAATLACAHYVNPRKIPADGECLLPVICITHE